MWYNPYMLNTSRIFTIFGLLTLLLVGTAQYLIFMVVPNEVVMGAVQRVFYFHVPAAVMLLLQPCL